MAWMWDGMGWVCIASVALVGLHMKTVTSMDDGVLRQSKSMGIGVGTITSLLDMMLYERQRLFAYSI
jgi:hypothetical protein